jgi:hypothetical protein
MHVIAADRSPHVKSEHPKVDKHPFLTHFIFEMFFEMFTKLVRVAGFVLQTQM